MHTFIIIISNEPALGINEPINQPWSRAINEVKSELSLCRFTLFKFNITRILSRQKLSISFSGRRLVCHFSLDSPRTKPGSVREITAQDATWKPFISGKTRGFLQTCSHPGHLPLLHLGAPPAPVAAYLRILIRGCGGLKPGQKTWKAGKGTGTTADTLAWSA